MIPCVVRPTFPPSLSVVARSWTTKIVYEKTQGLLSYVMKIVYEKAKGLLGYVMKIVYEKTKG